MTHVPASSHGSTFNGGTVTAALEVDPAVGGHDAFVIHADPSDTTNTYALFDQHGNLSIASGGTFQEARIQLDDNTAGNPGHIEIDTYSGVGLNPEGSSNGILRVTPRASHTGRQAAFGLAGSSAETLVVSLNGYLLVKTHAAPTDGELAAGEVAEWFEQTSGAAARGLKGKDAGGTVRTSAYPLRQTSGALPTVAPVSATAFQCSATQDVTLVVPVTYNPGVATTATCKVEVSPDNVTFSTLLTITQPVGTVFDGSIEPVTVLVPAAWYVKLTVVNATLGTGTYY